MKSLVFEHHVVLDAFMKTAQYLASLPTHDDIWDHVGEVMVRFYGADLAGFAEHRSSGEVEFHHMKLPAGAPPELLKTKDVQEAALEVLETGFLTWREIFLGEPHTLILLPVNTGNETSAVMIVGHAATGPISNELLNVYLAVAGLVGSTITKMASEIELKRYAERLEFLNQELQEFAFVASHDLQEPLRKIQAFGSLLESTTRDSLGEQGRDYLARMTKSAKRMSALLNALLGYSRIATRPKPFISTDLSEIAQDAVSDLELALNRVRGHVEIGVLPRIEVDPTQIRQLIQNLISNALKYRRKDETPSIKVHGDVIDSICTLYVEDNGIGFEEEYLDRIFRPFQRLHGRNEYEGTGMGLAICRKIVERHGGTITAKSIPGHGSVFIVKLPITTSGKEHLKTGKSERSQS